jgi:hypothetical protein
MWKRKVHSAYKYNFAFCVCVKLGSSHWAKKEDGVKKRAADEYIRTDGAVHKEGQELYSTKYCTFGWDGQGMLNAWKVHKNVVEKFWK